jgi:hypothetical protein
VKKERLEAEEMLDAAHVTIDNEATNYGKFLIAG